MRRPSTSLYRANTRAAATEEELGKVTQHVEMMERQLRIVNNWVDDWVMPVKPLQSQHAWLHQMEQEAMLDDDNDHWEDINEERKAAANATTMPR